MIRGRVAARAPGGGEDVGGAGDVERLDVREGHHDDATGRHGRSIARRSRGSKDALRTDPAISGDRAAGRSEPVVRPAGDEVRRQPPALARRDVGEGETGHAAGDA